MEWKVNVENQPNQRILVRFVPQKELITFTGQYKPHNKEWVDFSYDEYSMYIDALTIENLLFSTYKKMKERLTVYEDIAKGFTLINRFEVLED
jgi:hypothetical protein